jgi:hypothetical protein
LPPRGRLVKAIKKRLALIILFCVCTLIIISCDAFYIARGVVTEVIKDQNTGTSISNYLKDVEINAFYIGRQGHVGPLVNNHLFTDSEGKYSIFFAGPPGGLDCSVFLEFKKPGYKDNKIFIDDNNTDADVTIKRCPEKIKYQGCWTIDVILKRESGN